MLGLLMYVLRIENDEEREARIAARNGMQLWKRQLRDASNPFTLPQEMFRMHYRLTQRSAMQLVEMLMPHLTLHELAIPPHMQVLSVLRFLAEGSYQKGVANDLHQPMSQPTFSKYLHVVVNAINTLRDQYIRFPVTPEERQRLSRRFEEGIGFPGVIGAIDATLIKIHTPSDHEEAYVNRRQQHSLNVQLICDMDYKISNLRIASGSTNDQFLWNHSRIRRNLWNLRNNNETYYLIGDGGYTLSPVLLVPDNRAAPRTPEMAFSNAVRRTRCRVEQTIGILKGMWRCLCNMRGLHYTPEFAAAIVQACVILHNYRKTEGIPAPRLPAERRQFVEPDHEYEQGVAQRDAIIRRYF